MMRELLEKLRHDSWTMGISLGILVPALTFGILYGFVYLVLTVAGKPLDVLNLDLIKKLILLSIVPSVFEAQIRPHWTRDPAGDFPHRHRFRRAGICFLKQWKVKSRK